MLAGWLQPQPQMQLVCILGLLTALDPNLASAVWCVRQPRLQRCTPPTLSCWICLPDAVSASDAAACASFNSFSVAAARSDSDPSFCQAVAVSAWDSCSSSCRVDSNSSNQMSKLNDNSPSCCCVVAGSKRDS